MLQNQKNIEFSWSSYVAKQQKTLSLVCFYVAKQKKIEFICVLCCKTKKH
jgi:hypothetical protein